MGVVIDPIAIKPRAAHPLLKVYARLNTYPKPWSTIQRQLLGWAGHACEECGEGGDDVLLHVHHLRWQEKNNCSFENLVVFCVKCHTACHNRKYQPFPQIDWQERWGIIPNWLLNRGLHQSWMLPASSPDNPLYAIQPGLPEALARLTSDQLEICNAQPTFIQADAVRPKADCDQIDAQPAVTVSAIDYFLACYG